ncbi:periplasmic heavy metal sensor [Pseudomonas sp. H11T01]|uniref:periplasmic heavy metal sensor n=1 Tax=Pseudomonas sp. H11T01 TaxID=3402749 RepID=UPI003AD0BC93
MTQPSKHFKALLAVSLVLNVFLIGGVVGGLYQWHSQAKPALAMPQHGLHQAMAQLPPAKRHQLRQLLRQTRTENQSLILASRQARLDVIRQLQAPTLDRTALDSDLSKAREADITLRAKVDANLADFAATLPADERQTLADSLYERGKAKASEANKN